MKVRPSVKPICEKCKVIKRKGMEFVLAETMDDVLRVALVKGEKA